jgi:membrane protein DedA with SNARE-associated domain
MIEFRHELEILKPWIHEHGVAAVFVVLFFESFGVPLPGESLLIVAAILASRGEISFYALCFSAWSGAVLGDNAGYLAGRMLGQGIIWRFGAKIGLNAERLHKAEAAFARYGPVTVAFARFVNVLRQLNGVVAGTLKMDWRRFVAFNALGAALWVGVWTVAGSYLGSHETELVRLAHKLGLLGAIIVSVMLFAALLCVYGRRIFAKLGRNATRGITRGLKRCFRRREAGTASVPGCDSK